MVRVAQIALAGFLTSEAYAQQTRTVVEQTAYEKKRLVRFYTNELKEKHGESAFAQAMRLKMKHDGVPEHVWAAIAEKTMDKRYNRVDEALLGGLRSTSRLCPAGGCFVPVSMEEIWDYGCWCNMDEPTKGSGPIQDEYDEVCSWFVKCSRCAEADGLTTDGATGDGSECSSTETPYSASFQWDQASFGFTADCNQPPNDNNCAIHLCACQVQLITDVLDLLWSGTARTDSYQAANGFDDGICAVDTDGLANSAPNGAGPSEHSTVVCCGEYPRRSPYSRVISCCDAAQQLQDFGTC